MPKTIIKRDDWDQFARALYRTGNERVLAVLEHDDEHLEVLTVEQGSALEARS